MKLESQRVQAWRERTKKPCPHCSTPIYQGSKTCVNCRGPAWSRGDITIAEAIYHTHHRSSAYALIRTRARAVIQALGWNTCQVCGYSKHVEAAHRRPISDFPEDTKLSVVNDPTNLAALCRNHHWESDHGQLDLVGAAGVEPALGGLKGRCADR